jgi:hypothetical protein
MSTAMWPAGYHSTAYIRTPGPPGGILFECPAGRIVSE